MKTKLLLVVCLAIFLSACGKKDANTTPANDSTNTVTGVAANSNSHYPNPNNASYSATFDGKPVELNDSNKWGGIVLGGVANDGKTKINTVNFTLHGKNRSDYLQTIDFMDGHTGTTGNVNAIVNLPGQSFTGKKGGKATATITKAEKKDDNHMLYSGEFEVEMVKIVMGEDRSYMLKGKFENISVLTSAGILKGIGNAVGSAATNMKGK